MRRFSYWDPNVGNIILAAAARAGLEKAPSRLLCSSWPTSHVLFPPEADLKRVYFPLSGIVSLVALTGSGRQQEICMVGREGMVGVGLALGFDRLPFSAICQTPVTTLSLSARDFKNCLKMDRIRSVMERYSRVRLLELVRNMTCKHLVEQRFARWLLTASDRIQGETFMLTHAGGARLLDVRRASISEAAQRMQRLGMISYHASEMTIVNRRGLEGLACSCYGSIKSEFDQFLRFTRKANRKAG